MVLYNSRSITNIYQKVDFSGKFESFVHNIFNFLITAVKSNVDLQKALHKYIKGTSKELEEIPAYLIALGLWVSEVQITEGKKRIIPHTKVFCPQTIR